MATALWWVRRDLRLSDNQALARAMSVADHVVPLFVIDPALAETERVSERRLAFLFGGLRALDDDLRSRGSGLVVRRGEPAAVLERLSRETGAFLVVAEEDGTPFARRRDAAVGRAVPLETVPGITLHPLGAVRKKDGGPFVVFTSFQRAWREPRPPDRADLLPPPAELPSLRDVASDGVPGSPAAAGMVPFVPGEAEARRRLEAFTRTGDPPPVYGYAVGRDRPDLEGTSRISPYLRFGMISAREAVVAAREAIDGAGDPTARNGAETWLSELVWREFFHAVLHHFPQVYSGSFRDDLRGIAWRHDPGQLAAWQDGRTGYPFVDAAMRQLAATGWMHNRARMVVASFLAKDLLLDWRLGEAHFMRCLVDGDPAANNGGWQWSAGTGTDAAPYFRVFNPTTQGRRHDPEGVFVRRWVPELAAVPDRHIHEPWLLTGSEQRAAGCRIGVDYPSPIVDHGWARARALAAYGTARRGTRGAAPT